MAVSQDSNSVATPPRRMRRGGCLFVFLTVTFALAALWYFGDSARYALDLPRDDEVATMHAWLRTRREGRDLEFKKFLVPNEHIQTILDGLRPASRDWLPANWMKLG